jgi:hypothetical protein
VTITAAVWLAILFICAVLFAWTLGLFSWAARLFRRGRHAKPHGDDIDTPDTDAPDPDDPDRWPVDEETAERASMARLRGETTETYPAGHGAQGDPATVKETPGRVPAFVPAPIRNGGWEPDDGTLGEEWDRIHPRWREHRELDPATEEVAHEADGLKALPQDDTDVPRPGDEPDHDGTSCVETSGPGHPGLIAVPVAALHDVEECPGGCRAHLRVLSPPVAALVRDTCDGFGDTDLWVDWFAMQVAVAA